MIMSKQTAATIGEYVSEIIRAILKCMNTGTPNARDIGIVRVTRIDSNAFNVGALASEKNGFSFGLQTTADLIGNYLLGRAWLDGSMDSFLRYLKAEAAAIGDGPGWLPDAKEYGRRLFDMANGIKAKAQIEATAIKPTSDDKTTMTPDEAERYALLRKLRRAEKAAVEGVVSRNAIKDVIEKMEARIEGQYDSSLYDLYSGYIDALSDIFGV